jgi:2-haloacid dehalogenase
MLAGEVAGTADLVRRLKADGVPLYLLTNMPAEVFRARRARFDVLQQFDGAVVSGDEGVLKPSPESFEILVSRFDLEPASTIFIDDSEINVRGARAAGFQAHHFVDAATLAPVLDAVRPVDRSDGLA